MKSYDLVVASGLSGGGIHVMVQVIRSAPEPGWWVVLDEEDDPIGHVLALDRYHVRPTVLPSGLVLPLASTRTDAMRDIVSHLSDHQDARLDLEWREEMR